MIKTSGLSGLIATSLLASALFAQNDAAVLSGRVTDPAGLGVAGAQLTLTATATGSVRSTSSLTGGIYRFDLLQPGDYAIKATVAGFKTFEDQNLHLQVAQSSSFDIP